MSSSLDPSSQTIVIKPRSGWQLIDWRELIEYRDLFYFLVKRDVLAIYKQTVLGFTWAIIRPVFSMIIFSLVFGGLAKIPSDGIPYPIFSYAALIPWTYFSAAMTASTQSLIAGKGIFTKVYFPRLIIPLTPVLSKLIDFAIAFIILFALMAWYGISPNTNLIFLPALILLMMLTASGIGMWLSAMAIQYRDIPQGVGFLSQLMMYAAPVVWPLSLLKNRYGESITYLYGLYPMVGVIEGFRSALLGHNPMPWELISVGTVAAISLFVSGALYFSKKERIFVDVA
ncbi:MAG: phosphate ABC transporter permease [Candidatus Marinimicrobia bacterium]|nr:phosphate ABC transporter permease [Candidatus Neomarinimicrobiota bacterium]|tara:strand:+ start:22772 stop:23626 length:855 start_codon:yes stop_codon:yes gene_type:complete